MRPPPKCPATGRQTPLRVWFRVEIPSVLNFPFATASHMGYRSPYPDILQANWRCRSKRVATLLAGAAGGGGAAATPVVTTPCSMSMKEFTAVSNKPRAPIPAVGGGPPGYPPPPWSPQSTGPVSGAGVCCGLLPVPGPPGVEVVWVGVGAGCASKGLPLALPLCRCRVTYPLVRYIGRGVVGLSHPCGQKNQ